MTKTKLTLLIIISFYMMLLMGTVYAYSIFRTDIKDIYGVTTLISGVPYMLSLSFYALSMMFTGRYINDKNLRQVAFIGSLLIVLGFFMSYMTQNFLVFSMSYGVLIGFGVGMVYGVPIYIMQRYFSKRSGLYTGIILLGFGLSPLITAPMGSLLLSNFGLNKTFLSFAILILITQVPLTLIFKVDTKDNKQLKINQSVKIIDKKFLILYTLFIITTTIGLMIIGLSFQVGVTYYRFNSKSVTLAISLFALFNGVARPFFGYLIDRYQLIKPSALSLLLIVAAAIISLINQGENFLLFVTSYALFWFNLGAWLTIMPSMVKKYYQIESYSKVYGMLFSAYGIGAIISTIISGSILDYLGKPTYIYVFIMVLVGIAVVLLYSIKRKDKEESLKKNH